MTQKQFKDLIAFFEYNKVHIHGVVYLYFSDGEWVYKRSGEYDYKFKKENPNGVEVSDKELKQYRSASAAAQYISLKM